jgi:hypothetical protein
MADKTFDKIDFDKKEFIIRSLNKTWNDAHWKLNDSKEPLGDLERNNLEYTIKRAHEIMTDLGAFN